MISAQNIHKTYISKHVVTPVLKGIDLEVKGGEFLAIMGKSGAGKSTLMYQMSLLDRPTKGSVTIDGVDVLSLSSVERTAFRLQNLGYVFQDYALVPELNAVENVMIGMVMQGVPKHESRNRATAILERFGLSERVNNRPSQLSGGEQQRVSVARAVVDKPKILFADEPTANLDSVSSHNMLEIMSKLHKEGQTIVMVTHEKEYTVYADRIIYLVDGVIDHQEQVRK